MNDVRCGLRKTYSGVMNARNKKNNSNCKEDEKIGVE